MNAIVRVFALLTLAILIAPAGAAPEGVSRVGADTSLRGPKEAVPVDPQIAALQQQVQALQEQVAFLQSVLQVTPTRTTLRAPAVSIVSDGGTLIQSARERMIRTGLDMRLHSGSSMAIRAGSNVDVEGGGFLGLKGAQIRLNNGARPVATVGSVVTNGAITSRSATVMVE